VPLTEAMDAGVGSGVSHKRTDDYLSFIDIIRRREKRGHMLKLIQARFVYFRFSQFRLGFPDAARYGYVAVSDRWCNVFTIGG
jgi:hypothetical protein